MQLTVNSEPYELAEDAPTVADLLHAMGLADRPVAVELNAALIPKRQHASQPLADGDRVEVVTLVGGG